MGPLLREMLTVRIAQVDALSKAAVKDFVERLLDHLRQDFSDQIDGETDIELRARIRVWISMAESYGFVTEPQVEQFAELCICYDEMDQRPLPPSINEILTYPNRPPEYKLRLLQEKLYFREADGDEGQVS